MHIRLNECLQNEFDKEYILPFFWQHGEPHEVLEQEMDAIYACGIREMCVESRPHEQFGEEQWWDDFGFILEYAHRHGMKVWLLDDKHFPTGYANGYLKTHPELDQVTLTVEFRDFLGGTGPVRILAPKLGERESFAAIVALERVEKPGERIRLGDRPIVLDSTPVNGFVAADLPKGVWRVFYMIRSRSRHHHKHYIDMLNPESTKAMVHAVYEPHYRHFGKYFGNTFKGFFSDEPCFGNAIVPMIGGFGNSKEPLMPELGNILTLPWRDDLPQLLAQRSGFSAEQVLALLPALYQDVENVTPSLRFAYMETVSSLYAENFCEMLGNWCREHGVMYIGHIIEDLVGHLSLGGSSGHYFRALDGQDMAGIDIVLHQMAPGILEMRHTAAVSQIHADPRMYHYLLGKLASSHAHIDEKKKGRAMCEVFGAFGWVEGLPMMRKLADHFLSCGINYFVPHAFSPKLDDSDCPPYFYNRGTSTQFALFGGLMQYMQRAAHLLSGGTHVADVAVLYNTGRWTSLEAMPTEEVTRVLTQAQIDFDIIPEDYILARCTAENGRLRCAQESYGALVVPYQKMMSKALREQLDALSAAGVPVYFVNGAPEIPAEQNASFAVTAEVRTVKLRTLVSTLRKAGFVHLTLSKKYPYIRYCHKRQPEGDVYMFLNESEEQAADFTFRCSGEAVLYDAYENRLWKPQRTAKGVRVRLEPSCSVLVVCGDSLPDAPVYAYGDEAEWRSVDTEYTVSVCDADGGNCRQLYRTAALTGVCPEELGDAAAVRYDFTLPQSTQSRVLLDLANVGETAELWINGERIGERIAKPYRFEIGKKLERPVNEVTVRVIANQVYRQKDPFSQYQSAPLPGIRGVIRLCAFDD